MKNNQSGLSLIELLIGMGLMAIVTLVIFNTIDFQNQSDRITKERIEFIDTLSLLEGSLGNKDVCAQNFNGLDGSDGVNHNLSLEQIKGKGGARLIPESSLIQSIKLMYVQTFPGDTKKEFKLEFIQKASNSIEFKKSIPLFFEVNQAGVVESCALIERYENSKTNIEACQFLEGIFVDGKCNLDGIHLGSGVVCNTENIGAIRYNSTNQTIEFCNSSLSWEIVSYKNGGGAGGDLSVEDSTHSEADCTGSGGTVVETYEGTMCQFSSQGCPGGWVSTGWTTTIGKTEVVSSPAQTCTYTGASCKGYKPSSISVSAGSESITSKGHSWSKQQPDSVDSCKYVVGCSENRDIKCDDANMVFRGFTSRSSYRICGQNLGEVGIDYRNILISQEGGNFVTRNGAYLYFNVNDKTVSSTITQVGCK